MRILSLILVCLFLNFSEVEAKTSSEMKALWQNHLKQLKPYPEAEFSGKGIVIAAGGEFYLINAYVNLSVLRHLGCQLPVEIWYIGQNEYVPHLIEKLEGLGAHCRDITEVFPYSIKGFEVKAHAILASSFQEVMLLDADNVALDDPEYLFYSTDYLKTGALFWPDSSTLKATNPLFETLNLQPRDMRAQESGQLIIDKARCWEALNLSVHMNKESHYYYEHIYGDKDTFQLGWLATKTPFGMVKFLPGLVFKVAGDLSFSSFLQRNSQGRPIFCHTVLVNWSERKDLKPLWNYYVLPTQSPNVLTPEYPFRVNNFNSFRVQFGNLEEICINFLREVKDFD